MSELGGLLRKAQYGSLIFRSGADNTSSQKRLSLALRDIMTPQKNFLTTMIVASCFGAATFHVFAQTATAGIDQRQAKQSQRIAKGEASGRLSSQEAARMKAGQANVAAMETTAKADGKVTRAERKAIHKEQNKQSRRVYRQKHDQNAR
jgi:hypothetical protein